MPGKTRHHCKHRRIAVLGQSQRFLKRQLVLELPFFERLFVIVRGQALGRHGVKKLRVNAVRNAGKIAAPAREHLRHAVRIVRVPQLLTVRLRHGRHLIGRYDRGLHEVRAVVEAQNLVARSGKADHIVIKAQVRLALILNIMDREDALRVWEALVVLGLEKQRNQRRLPVVAVDDIGLQADERHRSQGRLCKIRVPLAVVRAPIHAAAAEIVLVVDKIDLELLSPALEPQKPHIFPPPSQRHVEVAQKFHVVFPGIFDPVIERDKHAHFVILDI